MAKYAIWDKTSPVITPVGEVLTAEQWKERYPVAALDSVTILCAAGEVNGGFFGTLNQTVQVYSEMGCDFTDCVTEQEKLDAIEAFEAAQKAASSEPSAEERIAAALEYQNLASL